MNNTMNEFADMVRNLCRLKGLQLGELAQKMNIRQTSLSQLLAKGKPKPSTFKKIAAALDVREEDLFELYSFPENYAVSARPKSPDSTTEYELVIEDLNVPKRPAPDGRVHYVRDSPLAPPIYHCSPSNTNRDPKGGERRVRPIKEALVDRGSTSKGPVYEDYEDEDTGETIRIARSTIICDARRRPSEKRHKSTPPLTDMESDGKMSSHITDIVDAKFWINGNVLIAPSLQAIKEITNLLASMEGMDAKRQASIIKLLVKEYGEK